MKALAAFWSAIQPIAVKAALDAAKASGAVVVACVLSEEFRAALIANLGVTGVLIAGLIATAAAGHGVSTLLPEQKG